MTQNLLISETPATIPFDALLTPALRRTILDQWSGPPFDPALATPALLHQFFEASADARPDGIALQCAAESLTYLQLDQRSNQLACHLTALGISPGDHVAFLLPRSTSIFIAMLAILKAGAAYVPIDADYPADRITHILTDSRAKLFLTTSQLAAKLTAPCRAISLDTLNLTTFPTTRLNPTSPLNSPTTSHLDLSRRAQSTAYIIYTSGSTGKPKGVPITHSAVCNLVRAEAQIFQVQPTDRIYQGFSVAFDASIEEIWLAFYAGATLFVATTEMLHAGPALSAILAANNITILSCVPTLASILDPAIPTLRLLILGGEASTQNLIQRWHRPGLRIVNTYGPTEATVIATFGDLAPDAPITIGRPAPNYRIYILDPQTLGLLPPGVPGELCISGPSLSPGYLHRRDLTQEKFLPNPFCDAPPFDRLYRTGDLAQWHSGTGVPPVVEPGTGIPPVFPAIDFLGRLDTQIKIRGFRVELSEIESALTSHPTILSAAVNMFGAQPQFGVQPLGCDQLVAYLIPRHPTLPLDLPALKSHLRLTLPPYMIPTLYEILTHLPTLPSGKVDRKSLPAPSERKSPDLPQSDQDSSTAPQSPLEHTLAAAFHSLFNIPIARTDDFFLDLGGHSLLAAKVISDLRTQPPFASLSVIDLYQNPTIQKLATLIATRQSPSCAAASASPPTASASRATASASRATASASRATASASRATASASRAAASPRDAGAPLQTVADANNRPLEAKNALNLRHRLCGLAQLLTLYPVIAFYAIQWITPYLTYTFLQELEVPYIPSIIISLSTIVALLPALLAASIAIKWLLLGRLKPGRHRVWGFFYFRWWLTQRFMSAIPADYLLATPLACLYYRALGCHIGPEVYLDTDQIGAYDLVSIGRGTSIGSHASLLGYTIEGGYLHLGPINVGEHCFIGASSSLRPHTTMQDFAELGNLSMLPSHGVIPRGHWWTGSPARPSGQPTDDAVPTAPTPPPTDPIIRFNFGCLHAIGVLATPIIYLVALFPGLVILNEASGYLGPVVSLAFSPVAALVLIVALALEIIAVKWVLLGRVKPGVYSIYSWFYLRKWFVDQLMDLSLDILGPMYATLYLNPWYGALGAKLGKLAEISTACAASPDLLAIGAESFVADAVSLGVPHVSGGQMTLAQTTIGYRAFIGNSSLIPAGATIGDNTLIGVLTLPPESVRNATVRERRVGPEPLNANDPSALSSPTAELSAATPDTTWLGSPALFLPQRQKAPAFDAQSTFRPTRKLYTQRLIIEFLRVLLPLTLFIFLASSLISTLIYLQDIFELWFCLLLFPLLYAAAGLTAALLTIAAKWLLIGRYRPQEKPLWCTFVWRSEMLNALHENLAQAFFTDLLIGTPFLCWFFRALGMNIGQRVLLDSAEFTEFDLVTLGDDVTLNSESTIQTHLFEDRIMKMSTITIGKDASIGANSVVLYDSVIHDGATLDDLSLVMKGESLPPHTHWQGTPASRAV